MSKAALTLDEINLLLNSEEPKNKKLYGNLYDILYELKPTKALTDEQVKCFDNIAMSALTYNKKSLIDTVIQEWYAERVTEEDPNKKVKCGLCNTPNKYLYYIRNRLNGKVLNVGSSCITKFPGIEGYTEQKLQLSNIMKNQRIINRRNEFHLHFPNIDTIILECEKYNDSLPIAIPFDLQEDLDSTIIRIRKIYNMYVESGKKPFKSNANSFELFEINYNHYETIKRKIDNFVNENISIPFICKRREILWLKRNSKLQVLKSIQKNNGLYTIETIGMIYSYKFIKDNWDMILKHQVTKNIFIEDLRESTNYLKISFQKFGYDYPLTGKILFRDFMKNIGAFSLFKKEYRYNDKDILLIAKFDYTTNNFQSIFNFIFNMMEELRCVFLFDYDKNKIILYRKKDKAVRFLMPEKFMKAYLAHILDSDDKIKNFLSNLVNKPATKWMTYDEQEKFSINDNIGKMYKEQHLSRI